MRNKSGMYVQNAPYSDSDDEFVQAAVPAPHIDPVPAAQDLDRRRWSHTYPDELYGKLKMYQNDMSFDVPFVWRPSTSTTDGFTWHGSPRETTRTAPIPNLNGSGMRTFVARLEIATDC